MKTIIVIVLTCLYSICEAQIQQYAVLIGSYNTDKKLIANKYNLNESDLSFDDLSIPVQKDIDSMKSWLLRSGFKNEEIKIISGTAISVKTVTDAINQISAKLVDSALFVLYFSGHGQQILDQAPKKDEDDDLDETLVFSKELWIDDDINKIFSGPLKKLRNIFIVDACFAGSTHKLNGSKSKIEKLSEKSNKNLIDELTSNKTEMKTSGCSPFIADETEKNYSLIYFGASGDSETAKAESAGSWLTQHLVIISGKIFFQKLSYRDLHCLLSNMAKEEECLFTPVYSEIGKVEHFNSKTPLKTVK